jgi:hypothetical protein
LHKRFVLEKVAAIGRLTQNRALSSDKNAKEREYLQRRAPAMASRSPGSAAKLQALQTCGDE